jgi:hypothetical protein
MRHTTDVSGMDKLQSDMKRAFDMSTYADTVTAFSKILAGTGNWGSGYISSGNTKITDTTAIFNMNSAHDCPNRESENCQVPWSDCYAGHAENQYADVLDYRRRQEYLWDCMTAELWADAFQELNDRKRKPYDSIRFSEAGDFRSNADIIRVNRIAEIVDIDVYTYSASDYLNWDLAENFTVNASNDLQEYGDRRYLAVEKGDDLPEDTVWCPNGLQASEGVPAEERIKCGECRLCINEEGPDVAIEIH